jgi:hypothetical protein
VLFALAAVTVIVVIAMMVKKGTSTDVSAGADTSTAPSAAPIGASAPAANAPATNSSPTAVGSTAQDRALRDPKNKFTIRVGQYVNDPSGAASAQVAYRYLLTEGALVIAPAVSSDGEHLVLCVGAEAKKDALSVQLGWVHNLRGPAGGKKLPYADAWVDNIDHVVRR